MTAIQQKVTIPADRRLNLELLVPEHIPVGSAEVLLVFSPAKEEASSLQRQLHDFAGCLAESKTFAGDSVALQRACRDEW